MALPALANDGHESTAHYRMIDPGRLDFSAYVRERLDMIEASEGRVPSTEFWIIDETGYSGRISLRHELNESLSRFGGHIGYDVAPEKRGRGYATQALAQCLVHACALGLERVLLTCADDNVASQNVIERNGGVLERIDASFDPPLRRYWIELV